MEKVPVNPYAPPSSIGQDRTPIRRDRTLIDDVFDCREAVRVYFSLLILEIFGTAYFGWTGSDYWYAGTVVAAITAWSMYFFTSVASFRQLRNQRKGIYDAGD